MSSGAVVVRVSVIHRTHLLLQEVGSEARGQGELRLNKCEKGVV